MAIRITILLALAVAVAICWGAIGPWSLSWKWTNFSKNPKGGSYAYSVSFPDVHPVLYCPLLVAVGGVCSALLNEDDQRDDSLTGDQLWYSHLSSIFTPPPRPCLNRIGTTLSL